MSALKWGQDKGRGGAGPALFGMSLSFDHFVLPRVLRRPVRVLARLGGGDFVAPRFSAAILSASLIASSSLYGAILGGHADDIVQSITARTGFAVDQIKVVGNRQTSEIDILDRLELDGWTSLIGFDAEAARERIDTLPWVEVAAVRKVYPHTLEVRVEEREPFALWQQGAELSVIERSGAVIAPFSGGKQALLPLIIGTGAPAKAPDFVAKINKFPELAARVKGYIRIGERRWDLKLENGITIKLPEDGEDQAIADLVRMDHDNGLLTRDIAAVDMRISDRLVVQLTPEAATQRQAALNEKPQNLKRKSGTKI
ncbi:MULTISPECIES: cell division protein FtsQ/DivIB [unclassified Mesorhizobium]|uniref:cell division protein FtsQ/DivIB n=1 Tax=unclassified Mesorhizobium TaxID=325217 RepID=UPI0003CE849D|nr:MULTISPECIES: cell division protein FtsQ/DivIB [unclassified Mesorhizobium]ESW68861.1 cell division protein FtsQ [Mesorhizobium sp. LSJC277A00]ESX17133.1 cell division protein FtsQ [Mesorhizobium sp. LSJC255A00]ESX32711.1 cell division protein FtsQ [Mesorhizobium sp. LSHC440B00]ESX38570.1 cell division protein FtsQ [Mesorhizobium sp. LSHC432A00]ESX41767.1 cell division protein FtsQ [Mesorhizobium sp. LSHC440A00]